VLDYVHRLAAQRRLSLHDPCFVASASSVACPEDVFAGRGILMNLSKPLPPAASPAPPAAFAMLLRSGAKCTRGTGTIVDDSPFYCSGETGVCRAPDLSVAKPAYFVKCGKPVDAMHVKDVTSTLAVTIYR
jgi:hypothetical protein